MGTFRALGLGALGLAGLLYGTPADGGDTGLCADDSRPTTVITDRTYQRDVLDYDGAVIVLHYGSQAKSLDVQNTNDNQKRVVDKLAAQHCDELVDGQPIRFAVLDAQHRAYMRTAGSVTNTLGGQAWGVTQYPTTIMILDGKEIDRMVGGPKDPKTIDNNVNAMTSWIDSNLQGIPFVYKEEDKRVFFDGQYRAQLEPF